MSNQKNYNSIFFLTTLSVYLGLVLVGATPPVLAQAALTQRFEVQQEIETEDDLDKKPDDVTSTKLETEKGKSPNQFIEQYSKAILALVKQDYFNPTSEFDELYNEFSTKLNEDIAYNGFTYTISKDGFFSNYNLKPKFENKDISLFGSSFSASLNLLLKESPNKSENLILKNTEIVYENNQVFIVTRLPRASIDVLLAESNAI